MAEKSVMEPMLHDGGDRGHAKPPPPLPPAKARRFRDRRAQGEGAAFSPSVTPVEAIRGARPSFGLVGVLLLTYLLAGTAAFYLVMDDMSGHRSGSRAVDALYFCVVTMTTVGYGDLVPASDAAKLLACAFAFAGVALVGASLSKAADYLVEKQEALVFRAIFHPGHGADADGGAGDPKSSSSSASRRERDMEANKVRYKLYTAGVLLAAAVASGTAFLVGAEGMRPLDAFYCVCATVTTLGYGDRSFSSAGGRAFAAAWITVSTVVVALFFLYAAELGAERRQKALARWVLTRRTTATDLEAADMDGDRRVSAAEFALYKLKELGKISHEDVAEFLEEFDELDADRSGDLTTHDLAIAQPH
ncbi:hypothetical protein ACP4OV_015198 [Aristida adscensionis]